MKIEEAIEFIENLRPPKNYSHTFSIEIKGLRHHGPGSRADKDDNEAINLAIQALEKQVAKKPKGMSVSYEGRLGNCPNPECNILVWERENKVGCHKCLQKLDWSVEK